MAPSSSHLCILILPLTAECPDGPSFGRVIMRGRSTDVEEEPSVCRMSAGSEDMAMMKRRTLPLRCPSLKQRFSAFHSVHI